MAVVAAAGAVTVAGCATACVLALTSSSSSYDEVRSGGATVAEAADAVLQPAPSRECAVCLSELPAGASEEGSGRPNAPAVRALPSCGHAFHAECIGRWLPMRPECPLCRRPVLLADGQKAAALATAAPAWARPARIACGFGDGRVVWTRSPSARQ